MFEKIARCKVCKTDCDFTADKCPNPDCPSNRKEKTLVELIKEWARDDILSLSDWESVKTKFKSVASDAGEGEGGKIVGLTGFEIAMLCDGLAIIKNCTAKSILKKLEAK